MKKCLAIILSIHFLLFVASCSSKKTDENFTIVKYSKEINGFLVQAIWKPNKITSYHVIGPAIIEFYNMKDSTTYSIANSHFSIIKRILPFSYNEDSTEIIDFVNHEVVLDYNLVNFSQSSIAFGTDDVPFFFTDIDFNEDTELVIAEVDNGQRGETAYKAYTTSLGEIGDEIRLLPYSSLDGMSIIDYRDKTITIYGSNGACRGTQEVYGLNSNNDLDLQYLIQEVQDDSTGYCYTYTYKIFGFQKELIDIEENE